MDSITYATLLGIVFLSGIFIFTYFETPRKSFNKGMKKLKNIGNMNFSKNTKSITIPSKNGKNGSEVGFYIHEY